METTLVLTLLLVVFTSSTSEQHVKVKVAVLLPYNERYMFSLKHIFPVLGKNILFHKRRDGFQNIRFSVSYGNSKCNSKDAPIEAFNFYRKRNVHVFFGPVCDYSLAPVARYSPVWNIPVISPGGFAHDFGSPKHWLHAEYSTLTRIGGTFNSLAVTVINIARHHSWTRIKVIYDGNGHSRITPRFCFLAASALVFYSKHNRIIYDFYIYLPRVHDINRMLRHEVGTEYAGKTSFVFFVV